MKPLGAKLTITDVGPAVRVVTPSRAADEIWSAVETAQIEGMTAKQFIGEVMDAWEYHRNEWLKIEIKTVGGKP